MEKKETIVADIDPVQGIVDAAATQEEPQQFRCVSCGRDWPIHMVYDDGGQIICRSCFQTRQAAASQTHKDNDGRAKAAATQAPAQQRVPTRPKAKLLAKITCPHCWHHFKPEDILWISQHAELLGDPILGSDAAVRFLPSRFNLDGLAIDPRGMACHGLACPHCHLVVPRDLLRTHETILSVIGVPASGKSYFLAAMTWQLRQSLSTRFSMMFTDTDPSLNINLNHAEETLFLQNDPGRHVKLDKTQTEGAGLYDTIRLGQQIVSLPRPLFFTLKPSHSHPNAKAQVDLSRILCLYDNAGEHFQPGSDSVASPVTQHMARSKILLFLYDPTQDPRFRSKCREFSSDPQLNEASFSRRQETVLSEAATRIRKYAGIAPGKKFEKPMVVVVPKADVWGPLISLDLSKEPFVPHSVANGKLWGVDLTMVEAIAAKVRKMLLDYAPEFVSVAEDFCQAIIYVPVSALGRGPETVVGKDGFFVPAGKINPQWVTVPLLYAFAKWSTGLIGAAKGHPDNGQTPSQSHAATGVSQ